MLLFLLSLVDESQRSTVEYLFNIYYPKLLPYVIKKLKKHNKYNRFSDAEDIIQNVFINILQYFPENADVGKAYIYTIANHEIYKKCKEPFVELFDDMDELSSKDDLLNDYVNEEELRKIASIANDLEEKYRIPVLLKYEFDRSTEEISITLGITVRAVQYRLKKAKDIIRKEFKKNGWIVF